MKIITKSFLIYMALLLLLGSKYAMAQETVPSLKEQRSYISVSGNATESFAPDTAILVLSIETTAKTAQEAVSDNAKKADAVMAKLKGMLNQSQGDSIKTTSYSLQPVWEWHDSKKKNYLTGYRAHNEITILTKQVKNVGNIIDAAVNSGANQIQSINFTLENKNDACNKAISKAATFAKVQAETLVSALGVRITGIKNASTSCGGFETPRNYMMKSFGGVAAEAAPTPVEAGEVKLNANVNVEYYIEK